MKYSNSILWCVVRAILFCSFLLLQPGRFALADVVDPPPVYKIPSDTKLHHGEMVRVDQHGNVLARYIGLGTPVHIERSKTGVIDVLDQDSHRIVEFDTEGRIVRDWKIPEYCNDPSRFEFLENGNVLVAAGSSGAFELDSNSTVVWKVSAPVAESLVTGAMRLSEGSTVLVVRLPDRGIPTLYEATTDHELPQALPFVPQERARNITMGMRTGTDRLVVADDNWEAVYEVKFIGRDIAASTRIAANGPLSVAADRQGGLIFAYGDYTIEHRRGAEVIAKFKFRYSPLSVFAGDSSGEYLISFTQVPDAKWPGSYFATSDEPGFNWVVFCLWLFVAAAAVVFILHRRIRLGIAAPASEALSAVVHGEGGLHSSDSLRAVGVSLFFVGLFLSMRWLPVLDFPLREGFQSLYGVGFGLMCVSILLLIGRGTPDANSTLVHTGIPRSHWNMLLLLLGATSGLSTFLFYAVYTNQFYPHQVGSWVCSLLLLIGLGFPLMPIRSLIRAYWRDLLLLTIPCTVLGFTLFYRLLEIPTYYHFDFTYYVISAIQLAEGRIPTIWQFGFVPAPIIGLLPHLAVYELCGLDPLVFRLGAALVGFLGIPAIYALGLLWKDRTTAFFAALLLAGNVSYIHFNRIPTAGEATIAALIAIVLFLQAWRTADYRWWILTGLSGGVSIYLWPVARTGVMTIFVSWVLCTLRWPKRSLQMWYGPLLLAFAFLVVIAPIIPSWILNPSSAIPRVRESMTLYDFQNNRLNWEQIMHSLGTPFLQTVNWFFFGVDHSGQGTLSPGLNAIESILFAIGFLLLFLRSGVVRIVFVVHFGIVIFICGVFADSPPWSTRLLPVMPIACLIIARLLREIEIASEFPRSRISALVLIIPGILGLNTYYNFTQYLQYEQHRTVDRIGDITLLGVALQKVPKSTPAYLVLTERPDWSLRGGGRLGELMPFILDRHLEEVRDLHSFEPLSETGPAVFLLQAIRLPEDFATIQRMYPDAKLEEVRDGAGSLAAGLVFVGSAPTSSH